jgi:hypothetical protein
MFSFYFYNLKAHSSSLSVSYFPSSVAGYCGGRALFELGASTPQVDGISRPNRTAILYRRIFELDKRSNQAWKFSDPHIDYQAYARLLVKDCFIC